jgi:aspartate/methionine/tyrosine aminotransferase
MLYKRMPIEKESPEEIGYSSVLYNLAESSVADLRFGDLNLSLHNLKLEYVAHRGHSGLRKLVAAEAGMADESSVLLTQGAAAALFIINTALLNKEDHLVVIRPNYATNIEVPIAIGCAVTCIDLVFEKDWRIDIQAVEAALQKNTKLISITSPHNPTGMLMTAGELDQLAAIAEKNNIWLLVDETYRDTCFKTPYPVLAGLYKKVISVSSLSKAFGLPGLRIGWIITQDQQLSETFLAAKEMIHISNSALDEEAAWQFCLQKEKFAVTINQQALQNYTVLCTWLQKETRLECVLPMGGLVCFPRFKKNRPVDTGKFYQVLQQQYKTMVGPGHWFDMPDTYMRIGFGWADTASFTAGLENISSAIDACGL